METMTVEDIARELGASVRTVRDRWVHATGFPAPALQPSPRQRSRSRRLRDWRGIDGHQRHDNTAMSDGKFDGMRLVVEPRAELPALAVFDAPVAGALVGHCRLKAS